MFQLINKSSSSQHTVVCKMALLLFLTIGIQLSIFSQCHNLAGEPIILTPSNLNNNPDYTTMYILTDYQGLILELNTSASFSGRPAGVYKAYSINYLTNMGVSNLILGSQVESIFGDCLELSSPYLVSVCLPYNAPCQSYSNSIVFNSTAYNANLSTSYVLTDSLGVILQISATTTFSNVGQGQYLIFGINYDNVNGLTVGNSIYNLSGTCYKVSNPIWYKTCISCQVNLGNDVQICNGQSTTLNVINPSSGNYEWSTGQQGSTIAINPTISTTYSVIFTDTNQCMAYDTINVIVNTCSTSNCYAEEGNAIDMMANGQNQDPNYNTVYLLTDYMNNIIEVSNTPHFTGKAAGVYKAYGLNYNSIFGVQNISVGNHISAINGQCFDLSSPLEIIICASSSSACNTFNGQYSFTPTGGNSNLTTQYILADASNNILEISNSPGFNNLGVGQFAVYAINYSTVNGLSIGEPVKNLSGDCWALSNPLWVKSCASCTVQLQTDTTICNGQSLTLNANAPVGGSFTWSTGDLSSSITVSPSSTTIYNVIYTNTQGCMAFDTVLVSVVNCNLCQSFNCDVACTTCNGTIQFNASGENTALTTSYILTDSTGLILQMSSAKNFQNVNVGTYFIFAINYDPSKPNSGLTVGSNYFSLQGECMDISQPLIVKVCEQSTVGNYVWLDTGSLLNLQDAGDTGINGIILQLYKADNPSIPIGSTTTSNHPVNNTPGYYQFDVCDAGYYFIKVIANGYAPVTPGQGDDSLDSDLTDLVNFTTDPFYVNQGEMIPNIDFGLTFGALPVEFLSFTGYRDHSLKINKLQWITANEINSHYFILEKTMDGQHYSFVDKVNAAGFSHANKSYESIDYDAHEVGQYLYKLTLVDYDGSISAPQYAIIKANEVAHAINVYPNPTTNDVLVHYSGQRGSTINIDLMEITGKIIQVSVINENLLSDEASFKVDLANYPDNTYILKIIIDDVTTYHRKIIKTH